MTVAKKIGAKQLNKMAPYKNDSGQKNLNQTAQDKKNAPYKDDCCQKNRSKTVEKNGTL